MAFRRHRPNIPGAGINDGYTWPKLFELGLNYTARVNVINGISGSDTYVGLFKPALTYYPLTDDKLSVALSYNSGADPVAGLAQQKFWQLAVQFQL